MRYVTAGESHGKALIAVVSDVPAGIRLAQSDFDLDLARRQQGYGRGGRMAIETDRASIISGIRFGTTIGSPVALSITNRDWDNWQDVMSVWGEQTDARRVTAPRPGHADLAGVQKTGARDVRDILERASARETAARVACGVVAKAMLREVGVEITSYVERIGPVVCEGIDLADVDMNAVYASDVSCPDDEVARGMCSAIDTAREAGESLGGVIVVRVTGLVPGLGGYAEAAQRLDAALGAAMFSVPAIKGVEFGDGFLAAGRPGSQVHDPIVVDESGELRRASDHAGGLEGGMTNGEMLVIRVAMKPIPTLTRPLMSVDLDSGLPVDAAHERSDVCAVPAAGVVAEAEAAIVLASAYQSKFGHDSVVDIQCALSAYRGRIAR